jgi:acyl carrier protein
MYRTGDVVRYRPDGNIEFLGRTDHQVKLRGFRIELGEIEAVLQQHAAVDQTVTVVREDRPGDRRIVAYVVPTSQTREIAPQLREHVAEALPDYMVPSAFVILDTLPLTPNGKLDRSALPEPDWYGAGHAAETLALPRTPMEQMIADVWKEVVGIEEVGLHDNFFDLGGHSLLLVQAAARMQEQTGVSIPLREYMVSNLMQLAQAYDLALAEPQRPPEVAPSPESLTTRLRSLVSRVVPTRRTTPE